MYRPRLTPPNPNLYSSSPTYITLDRAIGVPPDDRHRQHEQPPAFPLQAPASPPSPPPPAKFRTPHPGRARVSQRAHPHPGRAGVSQRPHPQPVDWLWQYRLAAGTLALLSGEPGAGKTFLALAIAAGLSRGRAPYTGDPLHLAPPSTPLPSTTVRKSSTLALPRSTAIPPASSSWTRCRPFSVLTLPPVRPLNPLAYTIDAAGAFHFTGFSQLTPQEMLAGRPTGAGLPTRKFAGEWLRQQLLHGSQSQYALKSPPATESVSPPSSAQNSISAASAKRTEPAASGIGHCPPRRKMKN